MQQRGIGEIKLSPREAEVLSIVGQGRQNKEIASILEISEATVKMYVQRLLAAVRVASRVELTLWYLQNPESAQCRWVSRGWVRKPPCLPFIPPRRSAVLVA